MGDFFKVVGASIGWVTDFSADLGIRYYEFLKRSAWVSGFVFLGGVASFALSEASGSAVFNTLGMLLMAGLMGFWVLASQPAVALGEQLAKIGPIRRITQRVGTALLLGFVITLYSLYVPAGTEGLAHIGILIVLLTGAVFAGFQLTRRAIGVKLIIIGLLFAAAVYFPQTASNLSAVREVVDRSIIDSIMPGADELELSLANLQRKNQDAPRLFLKDTVLWWCRRSPERTAGFRCFNQSGRDQITNEELIPISQEIVLEARNRLTAEKLRLDAQKDRETAERQEAERQSRNRQAQDQTAAAARAEVERLREVETERVAYIRRYISLNDSRVDVGLGFVAGNSLNRNISQQTSNALSVSSSPQFFTDQAVSDGVFARLFRGDASESEKLRLAQLATRVVLGNLEIELQDNNAIRGVINARIDLEARILDTGTRTIVDSFQFEASALGHSKTEAQKKAEAQLVAQIAKRVNAL